MRAFEEYYTDEKIIKHLCKIRISYARRRNKKHLLDKLTKPESQVENKVSKYDEEILSELSKILPNRRIWLTSGQRTHKWIISKGKKEHLKLDTDDKNREALYNTIKKYRRDFPTSPFVIELNRFIIDIKNSIESGVYRFSTPDILPEVKERNRNVLKYCTKNNKTIECRPIARFKLKDRIILSLANKFLTDLLDDFFEESSLAFRAVKKVDDEIVAIKHHDAIVKILDNKAKNPQLDFYVAECDIKKFYDSVNHKVCMSSFNALIERVRDLHPNLNLQTVIAIFKAYLECYSFRENVKIKNEDKSYWNEQIDKKGNPINGYYPWIEDDITNSDYYKFNSDDRIGVPQGGALSGLIANIVLDIADKRLKEIDNLFYVRYCDDMILMHEDKNTCQNAINIYTQSINDLHLFNHKFINKYFEVNKNNYSKSEPIFRYFETKNGLKLRRAFEYSIKPFWDCKSKGPYQWGKFDLNKNVFPWISFVGYEINYNGETRIRKKSLKKEISKQEKVIKSIIYVTGKNKNARNNTILRSAFEKLNGMAVGRIKLYNFKTCKNNLCWSDGFKKLNFNSHSKRQLKQLDQNKYKQISILKKHLKEDIIDAKPESDGGSNSEIYYFHKPFSYYYQAGQKKSE